ncbi:nuclear transport factor 2 family protein [Streptomyces sp. NPDC046275]|uniref:nuclear transport factor 2 family protein n=1 Tax=Streptomyces sp. NPDC046275 TaxID=3157201 RepID=UPI0033C35D6A
MDQALVERMWEYLNAGLAMDVEALDAIYDPHFENVRCDEDGRVVTLAKEQFMARFRALRDRGVKIGEALDDVRLLATSVYDGHGSVVMRRVRDGEPVLYTFVWRQEGGRWSTLLREFTYEKDLGALMALVGPAGASTGHVG